jgi:hypothetical protein
VADIALDLGISEQTQLNVPKCPGFCVSRFGTAPSHQGVRSTQAGALQPFDPEWNSSAHAPGWIFSAAGGDHGM